MHNDIKMKKEVLLIGKEKLNYNQIDKIVRQRKIRAEIKLKEMWELNPNTVVIGRFKSKIDIICKIFDTEVNSYICSKCGANKLYKCWK